MKKDSNVISLDKNNHGYKVREVSSAELFSLVVAKLQLEWGRHPEKNDIARFIGLNRNQLNCMLFFNNQRGQKDAMFKDAIPFLKMESSKIHKFLHSAHEIIDEKQNYIRLLDFVGYFRSERYRRIRENPEWYSSFMTFEQEEQFKELMRY
jgi:hypothetical protein